MSVSNLLNSHEISLKGSIHHHYNLLSAKALQSENRKLRSTNKLNPFGSILDENVSIDCGSTQAATAKPSRDSLGISETDASGKSGVKSACFEVDESIYHLPSQQISPVSSINELDSEPESETPVNHKIEVEKPFKTTFGTMNTEESAEDFPRVKSFQSIRLSPLSLLKSFLDPVSPKGADTEKTTFKKSSFYKREQDSQNNSLTSEVGKSTSTNFYNTSFEAINHKRKAIGKFYSPSSRLSLFKDKRESQLLSQTTNGNTSLPQTPKMQSPKGNSVIYQLNHKPSSSITVLATKTREVIRISRGVNELNAGERNLLKSSLDFYKPKTHNKFDVNNFYRQSD